MQAFLAQVTLVDFFDQCNRLEFDTVRANSKSAAEMALEDPEKQEDKGIGLLMTAALMLFSISITFIIILELFTGRS